MSDRSYEAFTSWAQLFAHIGGGYPLWYQAPMDDRPVQVSAVRWKDGKVRVYPIYTEADPFTADAGHLERFRRAAR